MGIMSNGADWCPLREGLSWVPVFNDCTNVMVMAASGLGCAILILARAGLSLQDNHVGFAFTLLDVIVINLYID